jgi:hypothetical protein
MAEKIQPENPTVCWNLLTELDAAAPERRDARELRDRLFAASK